jgi:hypothetical protein
MRRPFHVCWKTIDVESLPIKCYALLFTEVNCGRRAFMSITGTIANTMSNTVFATELRPIVNIKLCFVNIKIIYSSFNGLFAYTLVDRIREMIFEFLRHNYESTDYSYSMGPIDHRLDEILSS